MPRARLWRLRLARSISGIAILGLTCGGCSMPIGSLFGGDEPQTETTGSISASQASLASPASPAQGDAPAPADLAIARATLVDILGRGGKDASAPWENPETGARGTVTPIAAAYTQNGLVCRDFLASYLRNGSESWLQGEACRVHKGRWEVRNMTPWKRS
jgi:surface antigen